MASRTPSQTASHTPEERAEARRRQILDAAFRCLARAGFQRTRMRDLCAEAGLSVGAVYSYFRSKADILTAMVEEDRLATREAFARAGHVDDPVAAYRNVIRTFFGRLGDPEAPECGRFALAVWGEGATDPAIRAALAGPRAELLEHLAGLAARLQAAGVVGAGLDPQAVARVWLATHTGLMVQMTLGDPVDLEAYMRVLEATRFGVGPEAGGAGDSP